MRIVAGEFRGRQLSTPGGDKTRPTAARAREALFAILADVSAERVLDLYAGSGALGFEALSRGAASCLFVEQDRAAVDAIKANADKFGVRPDIRPTSVMALGPARAPLDLILMDPPYDTGAGIVALDKLARLGWTGPATIVSIETGAKEVVEAKGFEIDAERVYGKAKITLLRPIASEVSE